MKDFYIVDASGLIFRSYFAIRGMTNPEGQSTNAIFGFIRSLMKIIDDFGPEHIVSVFDGPKSWQSRIDIYPEYKANRTERPPDLSYQLEWAREFCHLMGIPVLDIPGVEADDTIGSVARWAENKSSHTYICSADKDLGQLVGDRISLVYPHKENQIIGPKEIEESFGVPPHRIRDYLAIVGDTSDNVPGVPGFGAKTAAALLNLYDSFDGIYAHLDEIGGKKRDSLVENRDLAELSKKLVSLHLDIVFPKEESFFRLREPKLKELKEFYQHKNFQSLLKDLEPPPVVEETFYTIVDSEAEILSLIQTLEKEKELCFDTETTSLSPLEAKLVGIALTNKEKHGWYIPCNGSVGTKRVVELLKPLFENPGIGFYGHNSKYDWHVLQNYGVTVAKISFDTMLASYILNAGGREHSLDALSLEFFDKVKIPISDLIGKGKHQISMWEVDIDKVAPYACEDVDYTYRLKQKFAADLKERGLEEVFYTIELPLLTVLAKMERRGMFVDVPYLRTLGKEVAEESKKAEDQIFAMAGDVFNLNSPKQLSYILFEKLGIKPLKKTTTGYSTNAEVLETLKGDYPIVGHILEYRQLEKLRSTYIDSLPEFVNRETGRIHCNFNQSVAATGRLASQDPNLQNIPVRTELGRKIRTAFRPQKEGWSYIGADYSQIELRLLAHLSEDPSLLKAFHEGFDVHRHTASLIFDTPLDQVTKEQRNGAKAVNFGIIYGQGEYGLAGQLGIKPKEAKDFIEKYFARYSKVREFIDSQVAKARETGKAVTMTGRERAIPEIHNKNFMLRAAAERLAVNTPLQGTAADLIKLAMLQVEKQVPGCMILQIHDELLFEVEDSRVTELIPKIRQSMEGVWDLKVPLVVDVAFGKNWEEC